MLTNCLPLLEKALAQVKAARGMFLLRLGEQDYQLPVSGYDWQALPGMQQMRIAAMPRCLWPPEAPVDTDFFSLQGEQGSQWARIRMASQMCIMVKTGSLLYCQDDEQTYCPLLCGETHILPAGQPYSLLGREDFLAQVSFTPRITQDDHEEQSFRFTAATHQLPQRPHPDR